MPGMRRAGGEVRASRVGKTFFTAEHAENAEKGKKTFRHRAHGEHREGLENKISLGSVFFYTLHTLRSLQCNLFCYAV